MRTSGKATAHQSGACHPGAVSHDGHPGSSGKCHAIGHQSAYQHRNTTAAAAHAQAARVDRMPAAAEHSTNPAVK